MPIDDPQPEVALQITDASKRMLQDKILSSAFAGTLSLIPGVGGAVIELMTELAIQRVDNRVNEMFEHFTNKIGEVGEDKVDREWFRSEEFQTLLFEAFRQLNVTHDHEKIEMLGTALANSGTSGFRDDERKDLFVHFVRELTRKHLNVLLKLTARPLQSGPQTASLDEETARRVSWSSRPTLNPRGGDDLLALQMLHAYGLVEEEITSSIKEPNTPVRITTESQVRSAWRDLLKNIQHPVVTRSFRLSVLGDEFLKFVGLPRKATQ